LESLLTRNPAEMQRPADPALATTSPRLTLTRVRRPATPFASEDGDEANSCGTSSQNAAATMDVTVECTFSGLFKENRSERQNFTIAAHAGLEAIWDDSLEHFAVNQAAVEEANCMLAFVRSSTGDCLQQGDTLADLGMMDGEVLEIVAFRADAEQADLDSADHEDMQVAETRAAVGAKAAKGATAADELRVAAPGAAEGTEVAEKASAAQETKAAEVTRAAEEANAAEELSAAEETNTAEELRAAALRAAQGTKVAEKARAAHETKAAEVTRTAEEANAADELSAAEETIAAEEPGAAHERNTVDGQRAAQARKAAEKARAAGGPRGGNKQPRR